MKAILSEMVKPFIKITHTIRTHERITLCISLHHFCGFGIQLKVSAFLTSSTPFGYCPLFFLFFCCFLLFCFVFRPAFYSFTSMHPFSTNSRYKIDWCLTYVIGQNMSQSSDDLRLSEMITSLLVSLLV